MSGKQIARALLGFFDTARPDVYQVNVSREADFANTWEIIISAKTINKLLTYHYINSNYEHGQRYQQQKSMVKDFYYETETGVTKRVEPFYVQQISGDPDHFMVYEPHHFFRHLIKLYYSRYLKEELFYKRIVNPWIDEITMYLFTAEEFKCPVTAPQKMEKEDQNERREEDGRDFRKEN